MAKTSIAEKVRVTKEALGNCVITQKITTNPDYEGSGNDQYMGYAVNFRSSEWNNAVYNQAHRYLLGHNPESLKIGIHDVANTLYYLYQSHDGTEDHARLIRLCWDNAADMSDDDTAAVNHVDPEYVPTDYEAIADQFLADTDTAITWKFVRFGKYFPSDKEGDDRLIWEFTISRGSRSYTSQFGESIADTYEKITGEKHPHRMTVFLEENFLKGARSIRSTNDGTATVFGFFSKQFGFTPSRSRTRTIQPPSAYSVLACLEKYEPDQDVDSWASDLGYEIGKGKGKTSIKEITRIHTAVREQYTALCTLFDSEEMDRLCEIS